MKIKLKRGYSVEVLDEKSNIEPVIDVIGNYSKSNYQATVIVNKMEYHQRLEKIMDKLLG